MGKAISLPASLFLLALGAGCVSFDAPEWLPRSKSWYFPTSAEWAAMEKCLNDGLTLESRFAPRGGGEMDRPTITVRQKLRELRAYCRDGKLYDEAGKELYFYRVPEFGNPPGGTGWQQEEQKRYQDLQERYRVIEMFCEHPPV